MGYVNPTIYIITLSVDELNTVRSVVQKHIKVIQFCKLVRCIIMISKFHTAYSCL